MIFFIKLWNEIEAEARYHSIHLCEELKSVLEPNEISSFKGDYKSGKRINMKKIIPYIASNFKKDKIWLRRNNPSKRKYQVFLHFSNFFNLVFYGSFLIVVFWFFYRSFPFFFSIFLMNSLKILLGIDNSLSMKEKDVGYFALESLTVLSLALTKVLIFNDKIRKKFFSWKSGK